MSSTIVSVSAVRIQGLWFGERDRISKTVTAVDGGILYINTVNNGWADRIAKEVEQGAAVGPVMGSSAVSIRIEDIEWLRAGVKNPDRFTVAYRSSGRLHERTVLIDPADRADCIAMIRQPLGPTTVAEETVGSATQLRPALVVAFIIAGITAGLYYGLSSSAESSAANHRPNLVGLVADALEAVGAIPVLLIGGVLAVATFTVAILNPPRQVTIRKVTEVASSSTRPAVWSVQAEQGRAAEPGVVPTAMAASPMAGQLYRLGAAVITAFYVATAVTMALCLVATDAVALSGLAVAFVVVSVLMWKQWGLLGRYWAWIAGVALVAAVLLPELPV